MHRKIHWVHAILVFTVWSSVEFTEAETDLKGEFQKNPSLSRQLSSTFYADDAVVESIDKGGTIKTESLSLSTGKYKNQDDFCVSSESCPKSILGRHKIETLEAVKSAQKDLQHLNTFFANSKTNKKKMEKDDRASLQCLKDQFSKIEELYIDFYNLDNTKKQLTKLDFKIKPLKKKSQEKFQEYLMDHLDANLQLQLSMIQTFHAALSHVILDFELADNLVLNKRFGNLRNSLNHLLTYYTKITKSCNRYICQQPIRKILLCDYVQLTGDEMTDRAELIIGQIDKGMMYLGHIYQDI